LRTLSNGTIKTGVYHADRPDREKEDLHVKWRQGHIKVVCATIGRGLSLRHIRQTHDDFSVRTRN
jgi:ATP-dependent DNA helicase Q1